LKIANAFTVKKRLSYLKISRPERFPDGTSLNARCAFYIAVGSGSLDESFFQLPNIVWHILRVWFFA